MQYFSHGIGLYGGERGVVFQDTQWQSGPTNTYGGTVAFKISYDNPGLRVSDCVANLNFPLCAGFGVDSSNFGKILIENGVVYLRNINQTGLASSAEGPFFFSNMIVDGGAGYPCSPFVEKTATMSDSFSIQTHSIRELREPRHESIFTGTSEVGTRSRTTLAEPRC